MMAESPFYSPVSVHDTHCLLAAVWHAPPNPTHCTPVPTPRFIVVDEATAHGSWTVSIVDSHSSSSIRNGTTPRSRSRLEMRQATNTTILISHNLLGTDSVQVAEAKEGVTLAGMARVDAYEISMVDDGWGGVHRECPANRRGGSPAVTRFRQRAQVTFDDWGWTPTQVR